MKKVTVKDIATLSGVSRGTVDRVLNDRGRVAEETRELVWKVAKQLGYQKNIIASSLATGKEIKVAVIMPVGEKGRFWYYPEQGFRSGMQMYKHYGINLYQYTFQVDDESLYEQRMEEAISAKPDAIILAPLFLKETLKFLQVTSQNEIPVFTINTEINHPGITNYVGQHSFSCGQIAGRLFYSSNKGINKIVTITPGHSKENVQHTRDKIDGLRMFFDGVGKEVQIEEIFIKNFADGEAFRRLHYLYSEQRTGILVTNSRIHYFLKDVKNSMAKGDNIIIGFDLLPPNIKLLQGGRIDFILNQNPGMQARMALENVVNYFIYKKKIDRTNYTPTDIVINENYKYYL